jgi:uncharacterized membrane protein
MARQWRLTVLGSIVVGFCGFGIYKAIHATGIALRGGTHEFNRLFDYPLWAIIHFAAAGLFMTMLPFQLWGGFRERHRTLHRKSGRVMFVAGLGISATSLFLPFAMPARPVSERIFMISIALLFGFFLIQAVASARKGDFVSHREWMLRAVAGVSGAMLQRMMFPVFPMVLGIHSLPEFWEYFVTSNWLSTAIVLGTAEWWIRSGSNKSGRNAVQQSGIYASHFRNALLKK